MDELIPKGFKQVEEPEQLYAMPSEPSLMPKGFRQVAEPEQLYARTPTIFERVKEYIRPVTDYFGLFPATPKTTPEITETGEVRNLAKNEEPVNEAMNALARGLDAASFGGLNLAKEAVTGEGIPAPETTWGTVMGAGASLVGFLGGGPIQSAKYILGSRIAPTGTGLRYIAQAMAQGGATIGIASGLSDIIPSFMESESFSEMGLQIGKSTAISTLIGVLFPATSAVPSKPLRMAVGLAVMDRIRKIGGGASIEDVVSDVIHGKIDPQEIASKSFDILMDLYFLHEVPSWKQLMAGAKWNRMIQELKINPDELLETIIKMRDNGEIPHSKERNASTLDEQTKIKQWEEWKEEKGLIVAIKDKDGNTLVGKPEDTHNDMIDRLRGLGMAEAPAEIGFVDKDGHYQPDEAIRKLYLQRNGGQLVNEDWLEDRSTQETEQIDKPIELASFADEYKSSLPTTIDLPELVEFAVELGQGKYPEVREKLGRGRAGVGVRGRYKHGEIELKADLFKDPKQVLYTLSHEIGHFVDDLPDWLIGKRGNVLGQLASVSKYGKEEMLGMVGTNTEIRNELIHLTHLIRPFDSKQNPSYTKYRYSGVELYADAISALFNAPHILKYTAPKFYDNFFGFLHKKPEVERLYFEMQDRIRSGGTVEALDNRIKRIFREGDAKQFEAIEKQKQEAAITKDKVLEAMVDKNHYLLSRLKGTAFFTRLRGLMEDLDYRVAEGEAYINDIYNKILKPVEDKGFDYQDYRLWTFYQAVINSRLNFENGMLPPELVALAKDIGMEFTAEGRPIANPEGVHVKRAKEQIDAMRQRNPDLIKTFEQVHEQFWNLRKSYWIDTAKQLNIYSEDLINKIESNEFYATFQVQEYLNKQYGGAVAAKIFPQKGTLKSIIDPFEATVEKDLAIMRSILRIKAVRGIIDAWQSEFPGEIKDADTMWNGRFHEIKEPIDPDMGLIVDMRGGKAVGHYVPKSIMTAFEANPLDAMLVTKVLRMTTGFFRNIFTEVNYGFWMFNIIRDYMRASRNLPGANIYNFWEHWNTMIKPAFKSVYGIPDATAQAALKEKLLISVTDVQGMRPEDMQMERLLSKYRIGEPKAENFWDKIKNSIEWFTNIGRSFERVTKLASNDYLKEHFPEMSLEERAHMVRSYGGSPDFLRKGTAFPIYNNLIMFSNAAIQGYTTDFGEVMRQRPGEFWFKTVQYNILPKLVMKAAKIGLFGVAIQEIMDKMSDYTLTNYFVIPLGFTGQKKGVALRIPMDETGRLIGGMFWKMIEGKFNPVEGGLWDYMAGQLPTLVPAAGILVDVMTYMSGSNPYDYFRGRYAIPDQVWRAQDLRTTWAFYKYLMNKAGIGLVYRFHTENDVEIRSTFEQILNAPIISNTFGRFLVATDYGEKEHIRRDVFGPLDKERARSILDAQTAVAKLVSGKKLDDSDWKAIYKEELRGSQIISRNIMRDIGRRYGSAYTEALITAPTIEHKIAILREIAKKQREK